MSKKVIIVGSGIAGIATMLLSLASKKIAIKTEYTAPWNFDGDPQLLIALVMMLFGFLFLYFLERNSNTENDAV